MVHLIKKKGFTLVELLVVISIIAVLTAVLLPNLMGARERARDGKKKQDADALRTALRMFYNDTQNYPNIINTVDLGTTLGTYLPNASNIDFTDYTYTQLASGDGFQLCVKLEAYSGEDTLASRNSCANAGTVCGVALADPAAKQLFVVCGW